VVLGSSRTVHVGMLRGCQHGWGCGLHDQAIEPAMRQRGPDPNENGLRTLGRQGQEHNVDEGPYQVCEEASRPDPHPLQDRIATAHRRQAALISVVEGARRWALPDALLDDGTYVVSLL